MTYYSKLPATLLEAIIANKCLLFVGPGISRKCLGKNRRPLPNWHEFLYSFAKWQVGKKKLTKEALKEIKLLLSKGKFLLVAEELLENSNGDEFAIFINQTFEPKAITPSHLHELISIIPFRVVITSNYDNLLEQAFFDVHERLPRVLTDSDIYNGANTLLDNFSILKIHGDIENPETIVLSQRSYAGLLYNSEPYRQFLKEIFLNYTILFIGYGGSDPDMEAIYDKLLAEGNTAVNKHFMLAVEKSLTSIEKNRLYHDRGIEVVEYVDYFELHNHIDTFFYDLAVKLLKQHCRLRGPIPRKLRSRIFVLFHPDDMDDGKYLNDYFFKLGGIVSSQVERHYSLLINNHFKEYSRACDCLYSLSERKSHPIVVNYIKHFQTQPEHQINEIFM
jgi:hypothetical protein